MLLEFLHLLRNKLFAAFFFLTSMAISAQSVSPPNTDSLIANINSSKTHDTIKIASLNALAKTYFSINPDTTIIILRNAIALSKKNNTKNFLCLSYIAIAGTFRALSDFDSALVYYSKGLDISQAARLKKNEGSALSGMGNTYTTLADYQKAILCYTKALKIQELINDSTGMAGSYTGLGVIFDLQADYPQALQYQLKAIKIKEKKGSKVSLAISYNNVGIINVSLQKYDEALIYYNKALETFKAANSLPNIAMVYSNLGTMYSKLGKGTQALFYEENAFLLYKKLNDENGMASQLLNLGIEYANNKQYEASVKNMLECKNIAQRLNSNELLLNCYNGLYNAYRLAGKNKEALAYALDYITLKDTIYNTERAQQINELNAKYQTEKKQQEIELLNKDKTISNLELSENKNKLNKQFIIILSALAMAALLAGFVFLLFNRNKLKQRTNEKLEAFNHDLKVQKHLVEEKQKEILDSINYAKRLQQAILPSLSTIQTDLKQTDSQFFIFYKPKDIVAGDFYYYEKSNNRIFIAAADCTGHGVPGALVSVVCSTALNRSVKEFNITDTGKILDKTRELVLETFSKSESIVKDGMDISLICLEYGTDNEVKVNWSGANNPLWYFSESASPGTPTFMELKGDKQPIGQTENPTLFTQHSLTLFKNDMLYLFTDGYADQFGGQKARLNGFSFGQGKKFKYKQLNQALSEIFNLPLDTQQKFLEEKFESWKGPLEQVDDVCIIGIRV